MFLQTVIKKLARGTRVTINILELVLRTISNRPLQFPEILEGEGEAIGETLRVRHLALHDMEYEMSIRTLTTYVLVKDLKNQVNCFYVDHVYEIEDALCGEVSIQPCRM